jgi:hypothetical protein
VETIRECTDANPQPPRRRYEPREPMGQGRSGARSRRLKTLARAEGELSISSPSAFALNASRDTAAPFLILPIRIHPVPLNYGPPERALRSGTGSGLAATNGRQHGDCNRAFFITPSGSPLASEEKVISLVNLTPEYERGMTEGSPVTG